MKKLLEKITTYFYTVLGLVFKSKSTDCKHKMVEEKWYQENAVDYISAKRMTCELCGYVDTNPYTNYVKRRSTV